MKSEEIEKPEEIEQIKKACRIVDWKSPIKQFSEEEYRDPKILVPILRKMYEMEECAANDPK